MNTQEMKQEVLMKRSTLLKQKYLDLIPLKDETDPEVEVGLLMLHRGKIKIDILRRERIRLDLGLDPGLDQSVSELVVCKHTCHDVICSL